MRVSEHPGRRQWGTAGTGACSGAGRGGRGAGQRTGALTAAPALGARDRHGPERGGTRGGAGRAGRCGDWQV